MGYLYIKVIESKKVAVRNSFFVNYPFIRVIVRKEKKSTSFKPGIEWWDKIMNFRVDRGEHQPIIFQARDKSIHVFGSDWLGEVTLDLDKLGFLDGQVHQMWYKFERGRKPHSRSPRGYIHLAFQYFDEYVVGKRPFSVAPVEQVLTFEEWLAANNSNWVSDSSQWSSTSSNNLTGQKKRLSPRALRSSAPDPANGLSPDSPRRSPTKKSSIDEINPDTPDRPASKSRPKTRVRAQTLPDVRSPSLQRQEREKARHITNSSSSDEEDTAESDDEPRIGTLIDFSFDASNDRMSGHHQPQPVQKVAPTPKFASVDDTIDHIKKLSFESAQTSTIALPSVMAPLAGSGFDEPINHQPTFAEWYHVAADPEAPTFNPKNPFLAMHENLAPTYSVQK